MDLSRLGKNLLFALALLLIVSAIDHADLPFTNRMEEYIAFVLTTDFEYEIWLERAEELGIAPAASSWFSWLPWASGVDVDEPPIPAAQTDR